MLSICWFALIILLYLISLLSGISFLQVNLFGFIPAIVISFILVIVSRKNFNFIAPKDFTTQKGKEFLIPITVINNGILPFPKVLCQIDGENTLTGEIFKNYIDLAIGPNKKNTININFSSETCGKIKLHFTKLYFYDFFGIFHKSEIIDSICNITILPDSFDINLINKIEHETPEDSNDYSKTKSGNDMSEIFQIREYRQGDSLKQIHWKLSDKFGSLMTKEASLPIENSIELMFDTVCPYSNYSYYDAGIEVLVSLSQTFLAEGINHKIIWKDTENKIRTTNVASSEDLSLALFSIMDGHCTDNISVLEEYLGEQGRIDLNYVVAVCCATPCIPDNKLEINMSVLCGYDKSIPEEYQNSGITFYNINDYEKDLSNFIL